MKIFVCLKQVPARDWTPELNDAGDWIELEDAPVEMNEPDAYALEEGLRLKEEHGGEVVAVSAGSSGAASTIREALAKGADRGLLIEDDGLASADSTATARAIAAAVGPESPDLILTGLQSDDAGYGQMGVVLAEMLGLPHATLIMEVQAEGSTLKLKRELEAGWFQRVEVDMPALLTIQSGINKVRYATLMGIKKARKKPLERKTLADLGVTLESVQKIERIYQPKKSKQTVFLEGSPAEQAAQLLEKLRHEARVLG